MKISNIVLTSCYKAVMEQDNDAVTALFRQLKITGTVFYVVPHDIEGKIRIRCSSTRFTLFALFEILNGTKKLGDILAKSFRMKNGRAPQLAFECDHICINVKRCRTVKIFFSAGSKKVFCKLVGKTGGAIGKDISKKRAFKLIGTKILKSLE